jgi:hypothetical protein
MFRVLAALSGSGQAIVPTVADEGQAGSPPGRFDRAVARDNGLAPAGQAAVHRADGQETVRRRKTKRAPVHADRCSVVPLQSPQRGFGRCDVTPQRTATSVKVTRPSGAGDVRNEDRNRDEDPGSTGVSAGRAWPLHPLYHVLGFALARCGTRQPAPPLAPTVQAPIAATIIAPCAPRQLHRSGILTALPGPDQGGDRSSTALRSDLLGCRPIPAGWSTPPMCFVTRVTTSATVQNAPATAPTVSCVCCSVISRVAKPGPALQRR